MECHAWGSIWSHLAGVMSSVVAAVVIIRLKAAWATKNWAGEEFLTIHVAFSLCPSSYTYNLQSWNPTVCYIAFSVQPPLIFHYTCLLHYNKPYLTTWIRCWSKKWCSDKTSLSGCSTGNDINYHRIKDGIFFNVGYETANQAAVCHWSLSFLSATSFLWKLLLVADLLESLPIFPLLAYLCYGIVWYSRVLSQCSAITSGNV